jgi:hypothetical protein
VIWSEAVAGVTPVVAAVVAQTTAQSADCVPVLWVGAITGPLVAAIVHQVRERKATADRLEALLNEDRRWYRERGPHALAIRRQTAQALLDEAARRDEGRMRER